MSLIYYIWTYNKYILKKILLIIFPLLLIIGYGLGISINHVSIEGTENNGTRMVPWRKKNIERNMSNNSTFTA